MKIPRHIHLAYLIKLLHKRILVGYNTKSSWNRQNKLVKELAKEDRWLDTKGFLINNRIVRL